MNSQHQSRSRRLIAFRSSPIWNAARALAAQRLDRHCH